MSATKAQRAALELAARAGGEIQIGGADGHAVRCDVAYRCWAEGWFERSNNGTPHLGYRLTAAGRAVLGQAAPAGGGNAGETMAEEV